MYVCMYFVYVLWIGIFCGGIPWWLLTFECVVGACLPRVASYTVVAQARAKASMRQQLYAVRVEYTDGHTAFENNRVFLWLLVLRRLHFSVGVVPGGQRVVREIPRLLQISIIVRPRHSHVVAYTLVPILFGAFPNGVLRRKTSVYTPCSLAVAAAVEPINSSIYTVYSSIYIEWYTFFFISVAPFFWLYWLTHASRSTWHYDRIIELTAVVDVLSVIRVMFNVHTCHRETWAPLCL